eukprot:CAMPEP_0184014604 /NCGR_PEP_ID=MMETSP0954-20121128/5773_1 /TAXON_ID=627963 /ORGANISM="Aplanochytrium sp, Strain PBS07" /LENGTH=159 /DNA_ID=CAMNT_0026295147 /DNA_START=264 /DNA_END=740 /DNA_ORIENTATION=+
MEATVQEGVLNKYSDEVHEMVRNQIEAFKKYSVAWLSHENIMVLSKSIGLIPVKAENVLKFLEKICETHRNGSLCDVEAERNQLAGTASLYHTFRPNEMKTIARTTMLPYAGPCGTTLVFNQGNHFPKECIYGLISLRNIKIQNVVTVLGERWGIFRIW